MAENKRNRNRKTNFTAAECTVTFEEAEQNIDIIKSKFTSTLTNKNKTKVWEDITAKVNSLGPAYEVFVKCRRNGEGWSVLPKKNFPSSERRREKPVEERGQTSPKSSSKKIIELFGDDPSFSGIQGGLESGKI